MLQFNRQLTSFCKRFTSLICLKHLVSSANKKVLLKRTASGRSLMYMMNKRGPRYYYLAVHLIPLEVDKNYTVI